MNLRNWITSGIVLSVSLAGSAADIFPVENSKGKWGYANDRDEIVIKHIYDEAGVFNDDGIALVKKGDNLGLINENGKEVLPIKYNLIERFSPRAYRVAADGKFKDGILSDEKYGFVANDGTILLKPEYDEIGLFNDQGLAYVQKDDKYGYINQDFKLVVPCKYSYIGKPNARGHFWVNEGGKPLKDKSGFDGGKYGILNIHGDAIIPVKHKRVGYFAPYVYKPTEKYLKTLSDNVKNVVLESGSHSHNVKYKVEQENFSAIPDNALGYYVADTDNGIKNAVLDTDGKILIQKGKYHAPFYPQDGMSLIIEKGGKINYLNMNTQKMLFKKPVKDGWGFKDGVAVIITDEGYQLIDKEGDYISSTYNHIYPENDGLYIVTSNKQGKTLKFGAINSRGREVVPVTQHFLYPPKEGLMACCPKMNGPCGYRGLDGKWAIEPVYSYAESFKKGIADVAKDGKFGIINPKGEELVKCKWNHSKNRIDGIDGYLWVSDDDKSQENPGFQLLHIASDKLVSSDKFKWVRNANRDFEGVAMVGDDNEHLGIFSVDGRLLIPQVFTFDQAKTAYMYLLQTGKSTWEDFDTYRVKLYSNPERNKGHIKSKIENSMWDY